MARARSASILVLVLALWVSAVGEPARATSPTDERSPEHVLNRVRSIADHGDLADVSFTSRALEVTFREEHRLDEHTRVRRTEFLFDQCPFSGAVSKCDYVIAQRVNATFQRGGLHLTLDPARLCISISSVSKVFGPGGKLNAPQEIDLLAGMRDRPAKKTEPIAGLHSASFEFPGRVDRTLVALFQFSRQPCLQRISVWQDLK